jgi:hypothetical protein
VLDHGDKILGRVLKITYKSNPHFGAIFSHDNNYVVNLTKKWVGLNFGRFFSQRRPVAQLQDTFAIHTYYAH